MDEPEYPPGAPNDDDGKRTVPEDAAPDEWRQTRHVSRAGDAPADDAAAGDTAEPSPAESEGIAPLSFQEVEREVLRLRRRYQAGRITRADLKVALRKLMLRDNMGRWWMIGVDSNEWYVHEGGQWVPATPPVEAAPPSEPATVTADFPPAATPPASVTPRLESDAVDLPPKRPPVEDLEATVVSPKAAFDMGKSRPGALPTQPGAQHAQVTQPAAGRQQPTRTVPHRRDFVDYIPAAKKPSEEAEREAEARRFTLGCLARLGVAVVVLLLGALLVFFLGVIVTTFTVTNQYKDRIEQLPELAGGFNTTVIYDAALNVISEINHPQGRRLSVSLDEISPYMIHATIATENERFYDDPGYDLIAISRALLDNLVAGEVESGASTITQQVVRWSILSPEQRSEISAWRKVQEIILASEVSRRYTKDEILGFYLNSVYYGNLAYGVEAAAQTYFGKSASELNIVESAFLAGLPQAPSLYDPVVNRDAALQRMNGVLRLMAEANRTGCIQLHHGAWADAAPLCVSAADWTENPEGIRAKAEVEAREFRAPTSSAQYPHFAQYVRDWLEVNYGDDIFTTGFKVYTTLDPRIQNLAQDAINRQLYALNYTASNAAVVAVRPQDGAILAMIGSADFNNPNIDGQVNMAISPRQPGSSIKPFTYLAALESGWTPATIIWDVPVEYPNYTPRNFDGQFHGPMSMRYALGNSYNIPAVKTYAAVGWERFYDMTRRFGVTLHGDESNVNLSVALGAREVTLLDMTSAYATLANEGARFEPYAVSRIIDRDGLEVYNRNAPAPQPTQVIDPGYAYLMSSILSDSNARAAEFGYNSVLDLPGGRPAAVKTGTTSDPPRDAWTVGYTPQLAVGVWVGNANNAPIPGITGAGGAGPIWRDTLSGTLALDNAPYLSFTPPLDRIVQANVCADTGAQAWEACQGRTNVEFFHVDHPPPFPQDDFLKLATVDRSTGLIANEWCHGNEERRLYLELSDGTAVQWLNNTPEGRAWAESRGIAIPLQPVPTEACGPDTQPATVAVTWPADGQIVSGVIEVHGRIVMSRFHRYQLEVAAGTAPTAWGIADGYFTTLPAGDAVLAHWDTRTVPDGFYSLRLIAFDEVGKTAESQIVVAVNNATPPPPSSPLPTSTPVPTETPFLTPTMPTPEPTLVPTALPTFTPLPTELPSTPTTLPTFTPLPTEPPTSTPEAPTWTPTWTPTATSTATQTEALPP